MPLGTSEVSPERRASARSTLARGDRRCQSTQGNRYVNNPNDEVINTLTRAHAGVLGDLGITDSAGVLAAVLGTALTISIP